VSMMSHDKIQAAARWRMAKTGEPYATARLEVVKARKAARYAVRMSEVVDPELIIGVNALAASRDPEAKPRS
jgi:hypothetical protein